MRFDIVSFLAFAAVATASAIPQDIDQMIEGPGDIDHMIEGLASPVPESLLEKRATYDHKGSGMCRSLKVSACDHAVNHKLIRDNKQRYGSRGSGAENGNGSCQPEWRTYGCGVFIQGPSHCRRTGNQMWNDYQDIRRSGAKKCGSKHWAKDCMTTINYVGGCHQ